MKLTSFLLMLVSISSFASTGIQSPGDCMAPRFKPGFLLLDSNLDRELNHRAAEELSRSNKLQVIEIIDWVQAVDGTIHNFEAVVLKLNPAISNEEGRVVFADLKKIAGTEVRCMPSPAFNGNEFIGL